MNKKSDAREFALTRLYQRDILGQEELDKINEVERSSKAPPSTPYGRDLAGGCISEQEELDIIIQETAENWRLDRMPAIDRNILRVATYELLRKPETPPRVVINEAIEMAKKYSTENSAMFVNGVLDKIFTDYVQEQEEQNGASDSIALSTCENMEPDPMQKADLHLHTKASDGTCEPSEVVELAVQAGLKAIAVTDHDTVNGVETAAKAGQEAGIHVIPALELTAYGEIGADKQFHELHILGYFLDPTDSELLDELERLREIRIQRIRQMGEVLRNMGLPVDLENILENESGEALGRMHVAREMVKQGICQNIKEAFDNYIGTGKPGYVPKERLTPPEVIKIIHQAGGCAVLAHPGFDEHIPGMLADLIDAGLDGLEVHYPGYSADHVAFWLDQARENNLLVTGGSDFHGKAKAGVEIGQVSVSMVEVCKLRDRSHLGNKAISPT
ncbi:MAG: transcription antitermination factor NusB [Planctomycetes bacterium]|nr:transcription antitermination factor NusB [Planctomycetota bacterium]